MPVDDPKLDPIWEMCAKHKRPVVIHIADPAAFFTPLDRFNERWHELNAHPDWLFFGEQFPKRQDLLDQLHRVIAKHPKTTFINTHFGNNAEDLAAVADKLDKYPNMYVDIDARISELGRQPYTARQVLPEVPGPDPVRHRHHAAARGLPHLLPLPGDRRRVLRLLGQPPPPGLLEHLRHLPAAGGAGEGLPQERRAHPVRPEAGRGRSRRAAAS